MSQRPAIDQIEPQPEPPENWNVVIKVSHCFKLLSFLEGLAAERNVTKRCAGNANCRILILAEDEEWTDMNCGYGKGDFENRWSPVKILVKPAQWNSQGQGGNPENVSELG